MASNYNPKIHHRKSIRLKGYDYSQAGLYFITICCFEKACLFGKIETANKDGSAKMILNDAGEIAKNYWLEIPNHFPNVILHRHIVMPNHIHGIIEMLGANKHSPDNTNKHSPDNLSDIQIANSFKNEFGEIGAKNVSPLPSSPSKTIGSIVRGFKIGVTKWFRNNTQIETVWQRNYYENIIRNEQSYQIISNYIENNPSKWAADKFHK